MMARSGLVFDPAVGLQAPETSQIREGVAEDWRQAFCDPDLPPLDTQASTPAGQLIDGTVAEIEAKNAELLFLANMFNPRVSEGRWQDALGHIYFLRRKNGEPTIVTCQLTGLYGTVIPYGALAQSVNGHTLICNRAVTIGQSGRAETTFRAAQSGPLEIPAHAVTVIITTIPGWDTVDNTAAGALGRGLETRAEFEARRAASVAANAHGSVGALFGTIANISGVLDVAVLENNGPFPIVKYGVEVPAHGVTICVAGGEDGDIAAAIYAKKDNGADTGGNTEIVYSSPACHNAVYTYRIMRPSPVNFWIRVTLGATVIAAPSMVLAIKEALYLDFYGRSGAVDNSRIGLASTVFASRFYCPALSVAGVNSLHSIKIALNSALPEAFADSLTISGGEVPVLALDNISVVAHGG